MIFFKTIFARYCKRMIEFQYFIYKICIPILLHRELNVTSEMNLVVSTHKNINDTYIFLVLYLYKKIKNKNVQITIFETIKTIRIVEYFARVSKTK